MLPSGSRLSIFLKLLLVGPTFSSLHTKQYLCSESRKRLGYSSGVHHSIDDTMFILILGACKSLLGFYLPSFTQV